MDWFEPMEPILTDSVIQDKGWIHQVKWDGIRGLCYKDGDNISLYTKSGRERSRWYPEVTEEIIKLKCRQAVLDGELIVLDSEGKPSFHDIMSRDRVKREDRIKFYFEKYPVNYMVFDILYKDGEDLRKLPLYERKKILEDTLKSEGSVHIVSDFKDGKALFLSMKERDMEGIVSKKADSTYIGGKKHRMWFKTKITKQINAVVCGLKVKDNEVKSLVIAEYLDNQLVPIGSVSSGLSYKDRITLLQALPQLAEDTPELKNIKDKDVIRIKPVLNVIVSFIEREQNGALRHPVLVGFTGSKNN